MRSIGGDGGDERIQFVAFFLQFLHQRFDGPFGKAFIFASLSMAHQTVDDAQAGVGGSGRRPNAAGRTTATSLRRHDSRWRAGIGRIHDAAHGTGHDGGGAHSRMDDPRGHRLPREYQLPAHQGRWVTHVLGHDWRGDGLLLLMRRLRRRRQLLLLQRRQVAGRGRRSEALWRGKRRQLKLANEERWGGRGGGGGRGWRWRRDGNDGTRMAVTGNRRRIQLWYRMVNGSVWRRKRRRPSWYRISRARDNPRGLLLNEPFSQPPNDSSVLTIRYCSHFSLYFVSNPALCEWWMRPSPDRIPGKDRLWVERDYRIEDRKAPRRLLETSYWLKNVEGDLFIAIAWLWVSLTWHDWDGDIHFFLL